MRTTPGLVSSLKTVEMGAQRKQGSKFSKIQFFRSNLDVLKNFFSNFSIFFLCSAPEDNLQLKGLVSSLNGSKNLL